MFRLVLIVLITSVSLFGSFGALSPEPPFSSVFELMNGFFNSTLFKGIGIMALAVGIYLFIVTQRVSLLIPPIFISLSIFIMPNFLIGFGEESFSDSSIEDKNSERKVLKMYEKVTKDVRFDNVENTLSEDKKGLVKNVSQDINIENHGDVKLNVNYNTFNGPVTVIYEKDGKQSITKEE